MWGIVNLVDLDDLGEFWGKKWMTTQKNKEL